LFRLPKSLRQQLSEKDRLLFLMGNNNQQKNEEINLIKHNIRTNEEIVKNDALTYQKR
jgi:hypothetical protein